MESAVAEVHEDVIDLVHRITHRFMQKYHIASDLYDDWFAEAELAFVLAYHGYDESRAEFSTYLWHCVWNSLRQKTRRDVRFYRTNGRMFVLSENCESLKSRRRSGRFFSADEFVAELSPDASAVARLTLDCFGQIDQREAEAAEIRLSIATMLETFGWSFQRICEAFHEIRAILNE